MSSILLGRALRPGSRSPPSTSCLRPLPYRSNVALEWRKGYRTLAARPGCCTALRVHLPWRAELGCERHSLRDAALREWPPPQRELISCAYMQPVCTLSRARLSNRTCARRYHMRPLTHFEKKHIKHFYVIYNLIYYAGCVEPGISDGGRCPPGPFRG